jgi:hypothetical protein
MWEQMASAYERLGSEQEHVPEWVVTMAELCHAVARVLTHLAELTPHPPRKRKTNLAHDDQGDERE